VWRRQGRTSFGSQVDIAAVTSSRRWAGPQGEQFALRQKEDLIVVLFPHRMRRGPLSRAAQLLSAFGAITDCSSPESLEERRIPIGIASAKSVRVDILTCRPPGARSLVQPVVRW
jgi:hypothetical protein